MVRKFKIVWLAMSLLLIAAVITEAQQSDTRRMETYPEILKSDNGEIVSSQNWEYRRIELVSLLESYMYGKRPDDSKIKIEFKLIEESGPDGALDGLAHRKQIRIHIKSPENQASLDLDLLLYLPKSRTDNGKSSPIFLGLNFYGNHTIHPDPEILIHDSWVPPNKGLNISGNRVDDKSRGVRVSRWPVETIIRSGYGIATIYCGQIDPDFDDDFQNGIHSLLDSSKIPVEERWGTISAWAWGLSRAIDYFETDVEIDQRRVVVVGHSRLGKTALWAGATDPRIAVTISNNSGCGGAAATRRESGETIEKITSRFPHWFCRRLASYRDRVAELPVDQHMLIAACAPRPVYVASASEDLWADPAGEFLSLQLSRPAFEVHGLDTSGLEKYPAINQSIGKQLGYHLRAGKHDITLFDWKQFIQFGDRHLAPHETAPLKPEQPGTLKIVNWNVLLGFNYGKSVAAGEQWIANQLPDVVALQEMNGYTPESLAKLASSWGHDHSAIHKTTGFPVVLTSNSEIEVLERRVRNCHHGYLHCKTHGIHFFVVHFWPGKLFEVNRIAVKISAIEKSDPQAKIIILGDFNTNSEKDRDYLETRAALKPIYDVVAKYEQSGLVDLTHKHSPDKKFSCPGPLTIPRWSADQDVLKTKRQRIDFIFANGNLHPLSRASTIIHSEEVEKISDHYPVTATIELQTKKQELSKTN